MADVPPIRIKVPMIDKIKPKTEHAAYPIILHYADQEYIYIQLDILHKKRLHVNKL